MSTDNTITITSPDRLGPHGRYRPGRVLTLFKHRAPGPWGTHYNGEPPRRYSHVGHNHQQHPGPKSSSLTDHIATRNFNDLENEGGPHVVICYMDNKPNNTFVAKIYDGVDRPPHGNPGCDLRMKGKACYEYLDCMARVELDYATETHAVFVLFFFGEGKGLKVIVPQFNGSFTFEVETHVPEWTARWVRMVLMDHYKGAETMEEKIGRARTIDGTVGHGMLPDEKTRLDILRKVSEASHKMWWNVEIGINALGPGKVLILSDGSVKLFGFTRAFVYRWMDQDVFAHPNHRGDRAMMGLPAERLKP
ncbi:LOW QUALITY PROTEIN: hypothetical protein QC762_408455 [Podospora pseudocomata]|uniref:HNH nuclease domain-containing protein n=1 Tax=Podospora pseudocomata TaxID=2093779 RepID=A0ABR0GG98_9PEZI|nr:LOW QUALITY PROTEIN: hypothetical protein QC762_408455 [Podospora pseudocomata]